MTAKKDDAATPRAKSKAEDLAKSRAATEENTPEQPLGTEDPRHIDLVDIAPAPSGDRDHLNPGVPGDLPNEQPAEVPPDHAIGLAGFKPSPSATVRRADEGSRSEKGGK